MTKGHWRIDYVAVVTQLKKVEPILLTPIKVNKIFGNA